MTSQDRQLLQALWNELQTYEGMPTRLTQAFSVAHPHLNEATLELFRQHKWTEAQKRAGREELRRAIG